MRCKSTNKALRICQGKETNLEIAPFLGAILRLDALSRETDPDEIQIIEWMIDRLHEMLFKRIEQSTGKI